MSRTDHSPKLFLRAVAMAVLALAVLASCSRPPVDHAIPVQNETSSAPVIAKAGSKDKVRRVDPRRGGFEIGLGEWALAPEADAIRPGRVTFLVHNRGTMPHGFEIALEGESSGHGSGDLFKAETRLLQPGESTRMTVTLNPGSYEIECLVDGHDDKGMEDVLEVRRDAPLLKVERDGEPGHVAITDFSFSPSMVHVPLGTELTWRNEDSTDHTVTAMDGVFGSDALSAGDFFSYRFERPGIFKYRCAIHPEMKGKVHVE